MLRCPLVLVVLALAVVAMAEPPAMVPTRILLRSGNRISPNSDVSLIDFSAPCMNPAGQVAIFALTKGTSPNGKSLRGSGVFLLEAEGAVSTLYHYQFEAEHAIGMSQLPMSAGCAMNSRGEVAAVGVRIDAGLNRTGGSREGRETLVTRDANGAYREILRSGDAAPGLGAGWTFRSLGPLMVSEDDRVVFGARISPRGRHRVSDLDDDASLWLYDQREGTRLLLRRGDDAPGISPRHEVVQVAPTNQFGLTTVVTGYVQEAICLPGGFPPNRNVIWLWNPDSGFTPLCKAGDVLPGLNAGESLAVMSVYDVNGQGDLLVGGILMRDGRLDLNPSPTAVWIRHAAGDWTLVARTGMAFKTFVGESTITQISDARWGRGAISGIVVNLSTEATPARPRPGAQRAPHPVMAPWLFCDPRSGKATPAGPLFERLPALPIAGWDDGVVTRYFGGMAFDAAGNACFRPIFGKEDERATPIGERWSAIWLLTHPGELRWAEFDGMSAKIGNKLRVISRTDSCTGTPMSDAGEVAYKMYFEDGGVAICKTMPLNPRKP